jgi:hypothetical protein
LARFTLEKGPRLERRHRAMGANTDAAAEAVYANGYGRKAMVGAMLGTIFEWYDFFCTPYLRSILPHPFSHREMK